MLSIKVIFRTPADGFLPDHSHSIASIKFLGLSYSVYLSKLCTTSANVRFSHSKIFQILLEWTASNDFFMTIFLILENFY